MMLPWAWRASKEVDPRLKMRVRFVAAALREPSLSKKLALADPASPMGELLEEWPQTVGTLIWPYQCAAWDANTRFTRISDHLNAVRRIPGLNVSANEKLVLADLTSFSPGTSLIVDRSPWLSREG